MIKRLTIKRFKSILDLTIELGQVNVFVGANGSGKSNLLEALGVLGAAAYGRVDDETLLRRGVRPGVPRLYKSAFAGTRSQNVPHIYLQAEAANGAVYAVTLWNPADNPTPAWKFKTERLQRAAKDRVFARSTTSGGKHNQEQGLAALHTVELEPGDKALALMDELRNYSIHCPNTPALRGLTQDLQAREPVGLAGGRLPEAVDDLMQLTRRSPEMASVLDQVRDLIHWASEFSAASSLDVPLSPSAARSRLVVEFADRFMAKGRNRLTGYDASEGALYILYTAALALHPKAPECLAIDNVDQAMNPLLARRLMESVCTWTLAHGAGRQWLVTAHNPAVLDGLPLSDDRVRLYTVDRDNRGRTVVNRITVDDKLRKMAADGWTLSRLWMNGLIGGVPNV